jgi:hypothetical protein
MIGAIAGDIIGSVYERIPIKTKEFPLFHQRCRFTDDTVLTIAVADAILTGRPYDQSVREIGRRYPNAGCGGAFIGWLHSDHSQPYNSWIPVLTRTQCATPSHWAETATRSHA